MRRDTCSLLHGSFHGRTCKLIGEADVILALDWYDLAGALKQGWGGQSIAAKAINVSPNQLVHRGWRNPA